MLAGKEEQLSYRMKVKCRSFHGEPIMHFHFTNPLAFVRFVQNALNRIVNVPFS